MRTESFSMYMNRIIGSLKEEERYGTAYIYGYALKAFHLFKSKSDISFDAFNRVEMKHFEQFLLDGGRSWNTISTYFRALRAVYNRAVDEEVIRGEFRLFSNVFTGVTSDKKLALEASEMQRLLDKYSDFFVTQRVNSSEKLQRTRHILTLMFLLQGVGFADLIHLRKENLRRNNKGQYSLHFRRQKTGTELLIQVLPEAMEIIELYRSRDSSSPYLLDLLDGVNKGEETYNEYRHQLRKLNYNLSRLAKLCDIDSNVSSYTARHTWATLAKYCEVPEEVISEGLGHSSLEITRTYLKRFESEKIDKANQIINDYVFRGNRRAWNSF